MTTINENYAMATDPATGLNKITVTGRCTDDEAASIESGCTRRFSLVTYPHAAGAILKSLDGTRPAVRSITPPTLPRRTYRCVKVDGRVTPFAYRQRAGSYNGKAILHFTIVWQEVGGIV